MKREIKFRVWDKSKKIMRNGVDIKYSATLGARACYATPNSFLFYYSKPEDEILMQFTGFRDDATEIEIYEGDIIKTLNGQVKHAVITFHDAAFFYKEIQTPEEIEHFGENEVELLHWIANKISVEVIGNIYEHPELLTASGQE